MKCYRTRTDYYVWADSAGKAVEKINRLVTLNPVDKVTRCPEGDGITDIPACSKEVFDRLRGNR